VDPGAGAVLDEIEDALRADAAQRGIPREWWAPAPGLSTAMARDVMLFYSRARYEPLVVRAGCSHRDYGGLIERGPCAALLR